MMPSDFHLKYNFHIQVAMKCQMWYDIQFVNSSLGKKINVDKVY